MRQSWHSREELTPAARRKLSEVDVVLDIGCGIHPQSLIAPLVHVCCEPYGEYAKHLQAKSNSDPARTHVVLQLSWADALRVFPEQSVDTVFLIDVIEHLEKDEGAKLLAATERIARRQIVVFTPLGFMPQCHADGIDTWGLGGGAWQEHKSGWTPEDFDETWEIVAARTYHTTDNQGRPLEQPFGAFYAIKTLSGRAPQVQERQRLLRRVLAYGAAIENTQVLAHAAELFRQAGRIYRPFMMVPPRALMTVEIELRDSWLGRLAYSVARWVRSREP